ncbi:MAG TPA: hypothetical protein VE398_24000 [Acidobacteriota bacterium]|nr:hypothetical protein [Acidobacteriota bacterium]
MIDILNSFLRRMFDAVFYVLHGMNSWVAIIVVSLLTALLMLFVYRIASNQQEIRATKDKIIAHLLEVRLYRNSLSTAFSAQGRILWYNLKYLSHSVKPMLVMIVPLVLAIIQMDQWLGYESLRPGGVAIAKVLLKPGYLPSREQVSLEPSAGFSVEAAPLRIDKEGEVDWRLRADQLGGWTLHVVVNGQAEGKQLVIGGNSLSRISTARVARGWTDQLANPGEAALSATSPVKLIEISYPARRLDFFAWRIHWLVAYLALSVIFGFILKPVFHVEV